MFKAFEFCIPTTSTKVRAGPEWLHEIKQDGFRLRVEARMVGMSLQKGGDRGAKTLPFYRAYPMPFIKHRSRKLKKTPVILAYRT